MWEWWSSLSSFRDFRIRFFLSVSVRPESVWWENICRIYFLRYGYILEGFEILK